MLAGCDNATLSRFFVERDATAYRYLTKTGGVASIETMDDRQEWSDVQTALKVMGFSEQENDGMFSLLAAILHLGNVDFESEANMNGVPGCDITTLPVLQTIADVLGTTVDRLKTVLKRRNVRTRRETVATDLSVDAAYTNRDGLAKAIYARMFKWLVKRVNKTIAVKNKRAKRRTIGVLDIYGFEIFDDNGFEQFIINYCNEKLQQIFIELTLTQEQDEYVREGIPWTPVEYFDNAVICELIEARGERGSGDVGVLCCASGFSCVSSCTCPAL
jgi:myosin-1